VAGVASEWTPELRRIVTRLLYAAFAGIVVVFLATNLAVLRNARQEQTANLEVMSNALKGNGIVTRLVHDVEEIQLLVEAHIFETGAVDMDRLDRQIAAQREDLKNTTAAFERLGPLPSQQLIWGQLTTRLREVMPTVDHVRLVAQEHRRRGKTHHADHLASVRCD
jgi:hypothetical protein